MISFLLDMNLPPRLGEMLGTLGYRCTHISQIADARTSDFHIMQLATTTNKVILTHDLDFGELLAVRGLDSPSVVIFRVRKVNADIFFSLIQDYFIVEIIEALQHGALVIVDEQHIRVRELPLKRKSKNG